MKKRKSKELSLNGRNLVATLTSLNSEEMKESVMLRSLSCNSPKVSGIKKIMMRTYSHDANSTKSVHAKIMKRSISNSSKDIPRSIAKLNQLKRMIMISGGHFLTTRKEKGDQEVE